MFIDLHINVDNNFNDKVQIVADFKQKLMV